VIRVYDDAGKRDRNARAGRRYSQVLEHNVVKMNATLTITIILAFVGYIAAYVNNVVIEKRRQRLDLINKRINNLYGPLYVSVEVGRAALTGFFTTIHRTIDIDKDLPLKEPLAKDEEAEYRIWVENVLMPINNWCEGVIRENAHLIKEREMPKCIVDYIAHVSTYKVIIAKWKTGDFSKIYSVIPYPEKLRSYAVKSYNDLKVEQLRLIKKSLS